MEKGTVVEYIERQEIVCAVICDLQGDRICVLTTTAIKQHIPKKRIVMTTGILSLSEINNWLKILLKINAERSGLAKEISVKHIWEATKEAFKWLDIEELTQIWGTGEITPDRLAATFRALFEEKVHFQFSGSQFRPNTSSKIKAICQKKRDQINQEKLINKGKQWVKNAIASEGKVLDVPEEVASCLKSIFYYDKRHPKARIGYKMLPSFMTQEKLFEFLVQAKIFSKDENIELYQSRVPILFSKQIEAEAQMLSFNVSNQSYRRDITQIPVYTIDGEPTEDFDDGLSWEAVSDGFQLGIHITDVAEYVKRETVIDEEACLRASSIYMPDQQVSMLPSHVAHSICSMKEGISVPAITLWVKLSSSFDVVDWQIELTLIQVKKNLTYSQIDKLSQTDEVIKKLYATAIAFQKHRKNKNAIILNLPEVHVWLDEKKEIYVKNMGLKSPGRMMVAEFMVLANTLTAMFLTKRQIPAIFRGQAEPKIRSIKENSELYENWVQKKQLGRMHFATEPAFHATLGVNTYITATSPIRRYLDLVTQRQIRSAFGVEKPYTKKELEFLIPLLEPRLVRIYQLQFQRHRYWILRYLETCIGSKIKAIAIQSGRNYIMALLPDYMLECEIPLSANMKISPGTSFEATLQHVNARKNILSLFLT